MNADLQAVILQAKLSRFNNFMHFSSDLEPQQVIHAVLQCWKYIYYLARPSCLAEL